MIIEQIKTDVITSKKFKQTEFRIDERYKNKVLWMLINQYKHKIRTPVQEIISNARDAQRENGNPNKPLKITMPTNLDRTFIVRDYGVGIDENRVSTTYTSFGATTKSSDNKQTGGFGIGAKSPLSYTDSFNIKTYINGTYWFYVIAKNKDGGISINLLDTGDTTEENGTEVQIPVKNGDIVNFKNAIYRTTMFWKVQPIFNTQLEDTFTLKNGLNISEGLNIYERSDLNSEFYEKIIILVDGIPYEIDSSLLSLLDDCSALCSYLHYNSKIVISINTGDIDLLQTRESIESTSKSIEVLDSLIYKAIIDIKAFIKESLKVDNFKDFLNNYNKINKLFSNIGKESFKTVAVNNSNIFIDKKLELTYYDYKGKHRNTLKTPQKKHSVNSLFSQLHIDNIYYDDIRDNETTLTKNKRLRNQLVENNKTCVLITQNNASNFAYIRTLKLLGAKKLSSLEKPVKKKSNIVKGVKYKYTGSILAHKIFGSYGYWSDISSYKIDINLEHSITKFVYVEYDASNRHMTCAKFVKILQDEYNITPIKLSKSAIKNIKNDDNFTHINTFMSTFKPSRNIIDKLYENELDNGYYCMVKSIYNIKDKITDKVIVKMATILKKDDVNEKNLIKIPNWLELSLLKDYGTDIKNKKTIMERFKSRIENKYPLLNKDTKRGKSINYINTVGGRYGI